MSRFFQSFVYAIRGFFSALKAERNMRVHLIASLFACTTSMLLKLKSSEWIWIIASIVLVFTTELLNTAIERLCDTVTKSQDDNIRFVKDVSAAAVLTSAGFALVVAAIIWLPKLFA